MSAKVACVIPTRWSLDDYERHSCSDRSHFHFSKSEYDQQLQDGSVELVRPPDSKLGHKAVVRIARVVRRGLSCSVGAGLALMMLEEDSRDIAKTMLAGIRKVT